MTSIPARKTSAPTVTPIPDALLPPTIKDGEGPRAAERLARSSARRDDALLEHLFLKQLQREKRRADRSKAPLSIALFRINAISDKDSPGAERLLGLLHDNKRETDTLGCLGSNAVAIILPDTNQQGAAGFVRKIAAQWNDMPFSVVHETYPDQLFENLVTGNLDSLNAPSLASDDHAALGNAGLFVKRCIDLTFSGAMLVGMLPVLLIIAAAVALDSPGPVIFRQKRLGKGGAPFVFYKFRSMRCNVDDGIHREFVTSLIKGEHQAINQQDAANPLYKIKHDPRITSVGRVLRKSSLDELPQLFNVLKGDMSLVGPRPPLPYEAEKYQSWHLRRVLEIKPGITGLWQVEGRSKVTFDEMVRMDIRYIRNWSLLLDLKILVKTIKVVLRDDGAK